MVADGWALFEEAIKGAGEGDLPELLHHLRGDDDTDATTTGYGCTTGQHTYPIASEEDENRKCQGPASHCNGRGTHSWACPQCNMVRGLKNGCNAHIR